MASFARFDALPALSTTVETSILDLKETYAPDKAFEMAKDVAAFANHVGGALLIGATEGAGGLVGKYEGLASTLADKIQTSFSQAVASRCSPRPLLDFARFPAPDDPNKEILAVFVDPYIGGQLIGVGVKGVENNDKYKGDSYVFPVRTGKDCIYVLPEQLLMFTDQRVRRVFIQLSEIAQSASLFVTESYRAGARRTEPATFLGMDQKGNWWSVHMLGSRHDFAIDQVLSVFHRGGSWYIRVEV